MSQLCDRYRDQLDLESPIPAWAEQHRRACPACAEHTRELAWVTGGVLAEAGADLPLPDALGRRLRGISSRGARGTEALPALPMPPGLAASLRAIGRPAAAVRAPGTDEIPAAAQQRPGSPPLAPSGLPWWLGSASASVAASLLLALLTGALLGNPVTRLSPFFAQAQQLSQSASLFWQGTTTDGEVLVTELWSRTTEEARKGLVEARGSFFSISNRLEVRRSSGRRTASPADEAGLESQRSLPRSSTTDNRNEP